eukprot:764760-Prymnesium_polylepis.1
MQLLDEKGVPARHLPQHTGDGGGESMLHEGGRMQLLDEKKKCVPARHLPHLHLGLELQPIGKMVPWVHDVLEMGGCVFVRPDPHRRVLHPILGSGGLRTS